MKIRPKIAEAIATAGYIGYVPFAPGTFGSVVGCLIYLVMPRFPVTTVLFGLIVLIIFAAWIAGEAEKALNAKDPGCIVIDEIAGMALTFFALPFSVYIGVAGFALFRFFDILKPFPIRWLGDKCPGGIGVVIDDVAAGVMSNLILRFLLVVMHQ